ncbi:MAG: hypothetical protein FJ102_10135 [Deltaproteobacteria bacterium]|nr:hypothetical protein [Deltaproteobacteria bacterium]
MVLGFLLACADDASEAGGGASLDARNPVDTGTPWWEEPAGDADQDGWTAADGDCDDGDPAANPGVDGDRCGGGDEDCDGDVDEDADLGDHEPNDENPYHLGRMGDPDEALLWPQLFPESDVDRYTFEVEDGVTTWFSIEVWLYDVPEDADYSIELWWVEDADGRDQGLVAESDRYGDGGFEDLDWGGVTGQDDSGTYEVVVRSNGGARCDAPYTLQILTGGW